MIGTVPIEYRPPQVQVAPGVWQYTHVCRVFSHYWYYANLILHWRCKVCGALRHHRPYFGWIDGDE